MASSTSENCSCEGGGQQQEGKRMIENKDHNNHCLKKLLNLIMDGVSCACLADCVLLCVTECTSK